MKLNKGMGWAAFGVIVVAATLWAVLGNQSPRPKNSDTDVILDPTDPSKAGAGSLTRLPESGVVGNTEPTVAIGPVQNPDTVFEASLKTVIEGAKSNWSSWGRKENDNGKQVVVVPELAPDKLRGISIVNGSDSDSGCPMVIFKTDGCPESKLSELKSAFANAVNLVLSKEHDWSGIAVQGQEDGTLSWENERIDVVVRVGVDKDADTSKREPYICVFGHTS